MKKFVIFLASIGIVLGSPAADTVIFSNGDVLTGTVLEQNSTGVRLKSAVLGEIYLPLDSIQEVVLSPSAKVDNAPEKIVQMVDPEPVSVEKGDKSDGVAEKESWKWSGKAGIGFTMQESQSTHRRKDGSLSESEMMEYSIFNLYGTLATIKNKNSFKWDWAYRYKESDIRKYDDFLELEQVYRHDLSRKYFARAKTSYRQDYLRGIDQERVQTAELGFKLFDTPTFKFGTSGGAAVQYYERDIVEYTDTRQEVPGEYSETNGKFVFEQTMKWQLNDMFSLHENYTHLGNFDKYHLVFEGGLENKLIDDLFIRLTYRLNRDTDVMFDDRAYYKKELLTSLFYKF